MPETLLKKRKSQEAARAARREEAEKRKQVSIVLRRQRGYIGWMIKTTTPRLDQGRCCRFVNHLSGLTTNISLRGCLFVELWLVLTNIYRPTRRSVVSSSSVPSPTSRSTAMRSARRSALLARAARPVPSTFPRSPSWSLSSVSRGMFFSIEPVYSKTNIL